MKQIINVYGKYGIKLHFNGTERFIEIDDRIVYEIIQDNKKGKKLLGVSTANENEFWASLIEKAVCKLYSMENLMIPSIPSIECYHITGW